MSGALAGIRVIDFGQYLAGPLTAMILADEGADVIRVDPPGGPRWRHAANAVLQRGKRSIVLDLKQAGDKAIARRLIDSADVVVENFRPGVMAKLGLGATEMTEANDRLIYCSLPGFASDDPRAGIAAWEGVIGAATGLYSSRRPGGDPVYTAVPLASSYAAIIAANSILAALIARERGGFGQRVEVALFNAMFDAIGRGGFRRPNKPLQRVHAASDGVYECADGRWIKTVLRASRHTVWLGENVMPKEWLAEGLGDPDRLAQNPELAAELMRRLAALFKTQPAAHWDRMLNEAGIPCSVCLTSAEWLRDDHALASRSVIEMTDPELGATRQAGYPVTLSKTPPLAQGPRHALDADRASVLSELESLPANRSVSANVGAPIQRALEGMRVIDVTQILAGPTSARILAEYGAEVIKVNNPRAEFIIYIHANGGKRSLLLDLKSAEGVDMLWRLVEKSDVLLQNFARGVADRMGIGEAEARKHRADIVYASLSAYGYDGPRGAYRGWEPLGQAPTGMMKRSGGDGEPQSARFSVCDYGTGLLSAHSILLGLYHRLHTGEPQHVQTSLSQSGTYLQIPFMVDYAGRVWDEPKGQKAKGWGQQNQIYRASDRWFYLAALGPDGAMRLAQAEGLDGIFSMHDEDPRETLEERFASAPAAAWVERLTRAGLGAHLVLEVDEVMEDNWVKEQQLSIEREHPGLGVVRITGPGARLSRTPMQPNFPAPLPGWHTREIVEEVGLGERFAELVAMGVVAERLAEGTPLE